MTQRITIDPITRLEGHGKIEIFLNEEGDVANTYFQIPELRGFERFCVGRPVEELPLLTNRICGVCPEAHHMAGGKVIQMRKYGHTVVEMIGGRKVHPCTSIPGGLTKGITEEQRKEIETMGRWAVEFGQCSLNIFNDIVLGNKAYVELI